MEGSALPSVSETPDSAMAGWFASAGEKPYRLKQLKDWYFKRPEVKSFQELANFPKALREKLERDFAFLSLSLEEAKLAPDGSKKQTLLLRDSLVTETVTMPMDGYHTVCLSTQVGCPVGCRFCFSGRHGLKRNLTAGEMADSLRCSLPPSGAESLNLVIMGMGEPFYNYEALKTFLNICKDGFGVGSRRVTVSTVGVLAGIERFAADFPQMNLAVSLHAPREELRRTLIPRAPSEIRELLPALKKYFAATKRLVTFEYAMIGDVNDSLREAKELCELLKGFDCKINLIPLNEVPEGDFSPSEKENSERFVDYLKGRGMNVTVRHSLGGKVGGACGQLADRRNGDVPKKS